MRAWGHRPLENPHEFRNERFKMEDVFLERRQQTTKDRNMKQQTHAAQANAMLEERRPAYHICFQSIVDLGDQLEG